MRKALAVIAISVALTAQPAAGQSHPMSFFLTSRGPGDGASLGGLEGADMHCQALAESVGAGDLTWHVYLGTVAMEGQGAVDPRDRIGTGPWYNANGVLIAESVQHLHSENNNLTKETQLDENGNVVNGRGDSPNRHDILTGVFSPGERLIEVELSKRYSCGRAAIRSALVQLESEVLVDRKANRGAVVHRIDVSEAIETTEARAVLESLIAGRAARHATGKDAEMLLQIISDMRAAVASDDAPAKYREAERKARAGRRGIWQ